MPIASRTRGGQYWPLLTLDLRPSSLAMRGRYLGEIRSREIGLHVPSKFRQHRSVNDYGGHGNYGKRWELGKSRQLWKIIGLIPGYLNVAAELACVVNGNPPAWLGSGETGQSRDRQSVGDRSHRMHMRP